MIDSKAVLTIAYILLVISAVLAPYLIMRASKGSTLTPRNEKIFLWSLTAVVVLFLIPFGSIPRLWVSVLMCLPFAYFMARTRGIAFWGRILGFAIFSSALWWGISTEFVLWRIVPFWAVGAAAIWLLRQDQLMTPKVMYWALGGILALGLAAHIFTGPLNFGTGFATTWHHWGVYIATAQLLIAGAVPYADFPLQYGFGPMVTMAVACRPDCWTGAHYVISIANISYLMALTLGAGLLMQHASRGMALLSMLAVAMSVLLWTIYPPDLMNPLATPSTSGMRFLPLAALLVLIIHRETTAGAAKASGHVIWAISMLWSPESAIFCSMVWWPYLALIQVQGQSDRGILRIAAVAGRWVLIMIAASLAIGAAFSLGFWAIFGQTPDLNGYLIYIFNPPGPLPANLGGPLWILLSVLALAAFAMFGANEAQTRILAASSLATLAVTTYYLGRSHDNNILNLFPFIAITLISALRIRLPAGAMGFGTAVLLGMVIWPSLFGFDALKETYNKGMAGQIGLSETWRLESHRLLGPWQKIKELPGLTEAEVQRHTDLMFAIHTIRDLGQGGPLIINDNYVLSLEKEPYFWTTMVDAASYVVLPKPTIRQFVAMGKMRFNKPGWIILQDEPQNMLVSESEWLEIFEHSYTISESRKFGDYTAYLMVPK